MYEILPSEPLASLLRTFESWGGVVDYVLSGWDASVSLDPYELHKEAAIFTATTLVNRHKQHLTGYLLKTQQDISQLEALLIEERKGLQMRPDEAKGQQISIAEFFAPDKLWVVQDGVRIDVKPLLGSLEEYRDKPLDSRSYCHAFSDPPYTLSLHRRIPQAEIDALFAAINKQLFGENLDGIVVYQWSTDWVDYLCFYEGYDWWGSYLWTVYDAKTKIFVGITASATD
ncbi:hypothetical protein KSC_081940 [Ktedonobacter sp. SOSP1-52]|uniref:hypothetical protein n=1 Tax=Ktedonobacter sp. SOSP1-52 TaxID=2778366 RepID=UPI0019156934|nr:hypothetical protein [Ktedonobacter sp. SOSP1-52]GHO69302.1 hypothetical protein KSC_081940 [Ktedonobacter sp. SOSP1-52]